VTNIRSGWELNDCSKLYFKTHGIIFFVIVFYFSMTITKTFARELLLVDPIEYCNEKLFRVFNQRIN
jgi:hypothetical protein